ncbi:N-acetylmuramoyl-L-alanine amidase [Sporomusaceae bacterium BoRhaA]|uniref:N-acetylmuramoyl-L-alanine amidase family protein n=1 Tax=Pelorhabdus rhamnosifermentans TaxID=2772457 RepID=UPI001C05EE02|nr:N-acetylmuramoyl-L-alanine amidase [Pelorhabdus rhamnosifermentans]MBU2701192.1 N-acetylmuramoyl-L-alanine amidase [Pelorhabdus rhamnosifermentans]
MAKIFINQGHAPNGEPDPGAVNSVTGLRESDVAFSIGNLVSKYLKRIGYETQVMQSDSLEEICSAANNWSADLFISIHCNSAADDSAKGTECWACAGSDEGDKLANCIDAQIVNSIKTIDRGLKIATPHVNGLYVLTNTNMVACLVETAFISNADDEKLLSDSTMQDQFARAIARGVTDYLSKGA